MPPKKGAAGGAPSKKTEQKKKEKIIEDKTFGLKNKKGTRQQKFINNVTQQVKYGNQKAAKATLATDQKGAKRDAKKKEQDELNMLFRPVMEAQKLSKGADPKSVLCAFFKQGTCTKGDRCKFSHDLTIQRKSEKRSMYSDVREDELANDTMDNWDEDKLKEVVNKKHGAEAVDNKTKTEIVCKFFIQALEDMKYGWFWTCPNGGNKCKYRHALPPGFVLKRDKKKMEEQEEEKVTLEEHIEDERNKLTGNLTKITLESFMQWKKRKIADKRKKLEEDQAKKRNELKQGKSLGVTGRELFQFKPEMMCEDDEEADVVSYKREDDDEDQSVSVQDVSIEAFAALAMEVDTSSASGITSRLQDRAPSGAAALPTPGCNGFDQDEANKLGEAAAILPEDEATIGAVAAAESALVDDGNELLGDVDIDEDLFGAEADIDHELEQIDLED